MPATTIITTISTRNQSRSWEAIELISESFDPDTADLAEGLATYLREDQGAPAGEYRMSLATVDYVDLGEVEGYWDGDALTTN